MKKKYIKTLSVIAIVSTIYTSSLPVLADGNENINDLNNQIANIQTQVDELNSKLEVKNKELEETNNEISKRDKIIDNVNNELENTEQRKEENISNLADQLTTKLIESKTKNLLGGNDELNDLTLHPVSFSVLENSNPNIVDVHVENTVLTETSEDLEKEKADLTETKNKQEEQHSQLSNKKQSLENEIGALKQKISDIETKERIREKYGIDLSSTTNADVLETAFGYIGVPYVWGGTSPAGFDCSGFVQYVYAKHGVYLPRTTIYQENVGTKVTDLQPGDLLFYGSPSHHVTMYIGGGKMIEAPHSGDYVKISPVRSYTQARRVR